MTGYFEYIDAYFNKALSKEEEVRFEELVTNDQNFAKEVAFYLSAKQVLKEHILKEKKAWLKELLDREHASTIQPKRGSVRKIWIYRTVAAAAIIVLLISSWYLFYPKNSQVEVRAEDYIRKNLVTLSVMMTTHMDSLQQGLKLYNEGKLDASQKVFASIVQNDTSNSTAKKYLGIVYLRLANYDKALLYFEQLGNYPLYSNPGIFYQALTLMKRNQPGDERKAKQLLQQVADKDLEGKETALHWLKKM